MIFILNQGPTPMARDRLLSAEHVQNFDILGVVYVGEVAMPRKCIKLYNIYIIHCQDLFSGYQFMYDRDLVFGPRTRLDSSGPAFWATKSRAWSLKSTHWKKTKICRNKDILSLDPASALEIHHLVYSIFMGIWKIINSIKIHPSYKIQSTWYLWSFEPYSSMYYLAETC